MCEDRADARRAQGEPSQYVVESVEHEHRIDDGVVHASIAARDSNIWTRIGVRSDRQCCRVDDYDASMAAAGHCVVRIVVDEQDERAARAKAESLGCLESIIADTEVNGHDRTDYPSSVWAEG